MNESQKMLIELSKTAIYRKKIDIKNQSFNWNEIIEEAKEHDVKGLIYTAINKRDSYLVGEELYENLKRETLFTALYQKNHINRVSFVLNKLRRADIKVIVLKGLVIRYLYPNPDLRTMGDSDILIHKNDLYKVKSILKKLGYIEKNFTDYHLEFEHELYSDIEVHWTLGKGDCISMLRDYDKQIWDKSIEVSIGESKALSLSVEDLCLYLFIHMRSHMEKGFGIRQLCDITLFIEKERDSINWIGFLNSCKLIKCDKFIGTILSICNKLFELNIPSELESILVGDEIIIDYTINHIMSSGVHGKRNEINKIERIKKDIFYEKQLREKGIIKKIIYVIFPPISTLTKKYSYLSYTKLLAPIAYLQRIYEIVLCDKYEIFSDLNSFKKEIKVFINKNKIRRLLEL